MSTTVNVYIDYDSLCKHIDEALKPKSHNRTDYEKAFYAGFRAGLRRVKQYAGCLIENEECIVISADLSSEHPTQEKEPSGEGSK